MKYSWNAKTPMTSPDMVAKPIKWNPMSEDWKKRVEAMQLYNEDATAPWLTNEMKKTLRALRDRILTFGGDEVLLNTRDEDAEKVLERGQFFYGSKYMKKGEDCRCHQNAAYLWDANRGRCQIATGYALSEDGLWRQHSWVVQPMTRTVMSPGCKITENQWHKIKPILEGALEKEGPDVDVIVCLSNDDNVIRVRCA